jgi:hypothetical protein
MVDPRSKRELNSEPAPRLIPGPRQLIAASRGREKTATQVLRSGLSLIALGLLACGLMGCVSEGNKSRSTALLPSGAIDQIHLLSVPMALNMDPAPGPDGFAVKIFATTPSNPKGVAVTKGTLEILMFDGIVQNSNWETLKPLRIWSFPADVLRGFSSHGSLGIDYQLAPLWGAAKPTQPCITVVARYRLSSGVTLYSGPSVIAVGAQ